MTNSKIQTLERLRAVLEAYGVDPGRWPKDEREALQKCLAENPELSADYEDARSLDRMLDQIAEPTKSDLSQSSAEIMARINASTRQTDGPQVEPVARQPENSETVVELGEHRRKEVISPPPENTSGWSVWQTAGLLAATFVFGLYIGATILAEPAAEGVAQLTGDHNPPAMEFTIFQSGASDFFEGDL